MLLILEMNIPFPVVSSTGSTLKDFNDLFLSSTNEFLLLLQPQLQQEGATSPLISDPME